jgi:hypothetical protein
MTPPACLDLVGLSSTLAPKLLLQKGVKDRMSVYYAVMDFSYLDQRGRLRNIAFENEEEGGTMAVCCQMRVGSEIGGPLETYNIVLGACVGNQAQTSSGPLRVFGSTAEDRRGQTSEQVAEDFCSYIMTGKPIKYIETFSRWLNNSASGQVRACIHQMITDSINLYFFLHKESSCDNI